MSDPTGTEPAIADPGRGPAAVQDPAPTQPLVPALVSVPESPRRPRGKRGQGIAAIRRPLEEGPSAALPAIPGGIDLGTPEWFAWLKTLKRPVRCRRQCETALELHLRGYSYGQIARLVGYAGREVARKTVWREVERQADRPDAEARRAAARQFESLRLDYYLKKLAPAIDRGDVRAIMTALRVAERRARLLALDLAPATPIEGTGMDAATLLALALRQLAVGGAEPRQVERAATWREVVDQRAPEPGGYDPEGDDLEAPPEGLPLALDDLGESAPGAGGGGAPGRSEADPAA